MVPARLHRIARPAALLGVAVLLALPAGGSGAAAAAPAAAAPAGAGQLAAPATVFPRTIHLPDGFQPEGIAIGVLPFAYFGSLADGAIYRVNLVTGQGREISPGPGTQSVGLDLDHRGRLFVAGGGAGDARVVSAFTGRVLASYPLPGAGFVNDVIVTPDAAWFTDSAAPMLYRLPLGRHGALPAADQVEAVPLTGDFVQQPGFNANGITRTPDRKALLVVQSNTGLLFRVDPDTGVASEVDLGGATLAGGDGMLLQGRTLYVVRNPFNLVTVLRLDRTGGSGTVLAELTDPGFDVPTTVAAYGPRLYLPNARFGTEPTPTTPYTAVAIDRR